MRLLLLLTMAFAIKMEEQATMQSGTSIMNFVKSDPMGKLMFEFAQIEMHASGAVDVLMEVLKAFGRQQEERLSAEDAIWQSRLGDHNARRIRYESTITETELKINKDKKRLVEELIPRQSELDEILLALKSKKELNEKAKKDAEAIRNDQNTQFSQQTNEISEAIRATDEALGFVNQASGGSSLIEMKASFQEKLHKIKKQAETSTEYMGSLVQTLTDITEHQNFADREVQKELVDLLSSLRSFFVDTLQKAYAQEDQQKLLNEQRQEQLQKEFSIFDQQYSDAFQEREQVSTTIDNLNRLIQTREKEHTQAVARLDVENNNFTQNQSIHDAMVASVNEEIGFIEKAMNLLETQAFKDELQNAINKEK